MTALHDAASSGSLECAKVLVEAGIDLNAVIAMDGNSTALDYAVKEKKQAVGEYLRSKGAKCSKYEYPSDWDQFETHAKDNVGTNDDHVVADDNDGAI